MDIETRFYLNPQLDYSAWKNAKYNGEIRDKNDVRHAIEEALMVTIRERRDKGCPKLSKSIIYRMSADINIIEDAFDLPPSETEISNRNVVKYRWLPLLSPRDKKIVILRCLGVGRKKIAFQLKEDGYTERVLHEGSISDMFKKALEQIYYDIR